VSRMAVVLGIAWLAAMSAACSESTERKGCADAFMAVELSLPGEDPIVACAPLGPGGVLIGFGGSDVGMVCDPEGGGAASVFATRAGTAEISVSGGPGWNAVTGAWDGARAWIELSGSVCDPPCHFDCPSFPIEVLQAGRRDGDTIELVSLSPCILTRTLGPATAPSEVTLTSVWARGPVMTLTTLPRGGIAPYTCPLD